MHYQNRQTSSGADGGIVNMLGERENLSLIEQDNLSLTVEQLRNEQQNPTLNVLESEYIDTFDDALDVLEDVRQVNAVDVLEDKSARYIE